MNDKYKLYGARNMLYVNYNVLVVAAPRCGTYLTGTMLKEMGFEDQELHVYNGQAENYQGMEEKDKIQGPCNIINFNLVQHLKWSRPGTFVVGHPGCTQNLSSYLSTTKNTKVIFVSRDLRQAVISQMRFLHKAGDINSWVPEQKFWNITDRPKKLFAFLCSKSFFTWLDYTKINKSWRSWDPTFLHVRYEDLLQGKINNVLEFLDLSKKHYEYVNKPSRTFNNGEVSDPRFWGWGPEHDEIWDISGAKCLNFIYEE